MTRNKIHNGFDSGVLVCELGMGSVVDNEIYSNHMAGVAIGHGGASTVKGNTIRDGSGGSLCASPTSLRGSYVPTSSTKTRGAPCKFQRDCCPRCKSRISSASSARCTSLANSAE